MKHRTTPRPITPVLVAILLTAVAAAVYRSFVFSRFDEIRVEISGAELHSSRHVVTLAVPDVPHLRPHAAVLGVRLRNFASEERHVGLFLEGLSNSRIVLPPHGTVDWDVVLPATAIRSLATSGDSPLVLEFAGDVDGWAVIGVDIRNYHFRLGNRFAIVVPERADLNTQRTEVLATGVALSFLALLYAFRPHPLRRPLRAAGWSLSCASLVVCLFCLILPSLSPYKLLLSRQAFLLVIAGLFSPAVLNLPRHLFDASSALAPHAAMAGAYWTRHEVTLERAAALLGLCAIAIAQPIFEVLSNSPEFFAARGTAAATAVNAVLAISVGIPLVLIGLERTIRAVSRRAAGALASVLMSLLVAAVVMPWVRRADAVPSPWDVVLGGLVGGIAAAAYAKGRIVRQFLTALAPAALIVPALFLLDPDVRQGFLPAASAASSVHAIERTPPVVFVVFDELPLNSLLDADENIDAERYPNFAALAREGFWFRNATTVSYSTSYAVPAILSGRYPVTSGAVPTLRYYPFNIFTALAQRYRMSASLRFQLCPPRACDSTAALPPDSVRSLLSDLGLVWLHIVLPPPLAERLPPVSDDWASFGETSDAVPDDTSDGRRGIFARFVSAIDGSPARLHFIHSMLPHMAFEYVPSGRRYRAAARQARTVGGRELFQAASPAYADTLHQRHLAQVGFVDHLVGDLILRLREVGAYDEALIIITADHGASYREGYSRRLPQSHNLTDILHVPLFIKLPGQRRGGVVDRIAETVDILPTILDVLGAKATIRLDGRSLIDPGLPERSTGTFIQRNRFNAQPRTFGDLSVDRAASLARKERRFGRGDRMAVYAPGDVRHLLGANVSLLARRTASDAYITITNRRQFERVRRDRDPLPLFVRGVLSTSRPDPLTVAVILNDTVAAIAHSYRDHNGHVFGTLIPETALRDGKNSVTALVLDPLPAERRP